MNDFYIDKLSALDLSLDDGNNRGMSFDSYPDLEPLNVGNVFFPGEVYENKSTGDITLRFDNSGFLILDTGWEWLDKTENIIRKSDGRRLYTMCPDHGVVLVETDPRGEYHTGFSMAPEKKYFRNDGQLYPLMG